jgi:NADH:ubiquinone oxidoreductase 27 kD subunit
LYFGLVVSGLLSNNRFFLYDSLVCVLLKNKLCLMDNFSNLFFGFKLVLCSLCNFSEVLSVSSLTQVYASSVWLERELSEFFGIYFSGLLDSRRLLLDYTKPKGYRLNLSFKLNTISFSSLNKFI